MHIMGLAKIDPAEVTPGACAQTGGTLLYPAADETAELPEWENSGARGSHRREQRDLEAPVSATGSA